ESGFDASKPTNLTILGRKVMLCIWWDQVSVVYSELLQPGETINAERYGCQLLHVKHALTEKGPQYAKRHDKVILLHDNAKPVQEILEALGWDVLPHLPYSPDIAP
ncbi:hypothetical protein JGG87_25320, partial [Salmonella enterica subsp. enterica serovar Typhimurium]|nr:hypothetical protein [Salmonella enterica subsp. enterica serovar Typhimurium]